MKRSYLIVGVLLLTVVIGCSGASQGGPASEYKVGSPELDVIIQGNQRPYQNGPFTLFVELQNMLAYNLNSVRVALVGFDSRYIELYSTQEFVPTIEGRSSFNAQGGRERLEFEGFTKDLLGGIEQLPLQYRLYVNYDSKVEFASTVCLSSNLYSGVDDGGCSSGASSTRSFGGQGAPLGVSSLELVPGHGGEFEMRLRLINQGSGKVGTVSLTKATLGGKELACKFRGSREDNGLKIKVESLREVELVCRQVVNVESSYETVLFTEFSYDYELNLKKELTILK